MKKKLVRAVRFALIVAVAILFSRWWDARDDYRTFYGGMSIDKTEYRFAGAILPFSSNDVDNIATLLKSNSIPYQLKNPQVVELWVPEQNVKQAKTLFAANSRGLLRLPINPDDRPRHDPLPWGIKALLFVFVAYIGIALWRWLFSKNDEDGVRRAGG